MHERRILERKHGLRLAIAEEMARRNLKSTTTEYGTVSRTAGARLVIKQPTENVPSKLSMSIGRLGRESSDELALVPV